MNYNLFHNTSSFWASLTGWTNVNLLYFPDSTEIASLKRLALWFSEINQSKRTLAW